MVQMNSVKMVYDSSGTEALHGVDLDIHDGEFVFLVGPSGSGKTTIIKLLTGEVDEIELSGDFFDYTEKYTLKTSRIHVPARIPAALAQEVKETACRIYRIMGCSGFARVDMFLTPDGRIWFNEVNTIPGFTAHSRFPSMLKAAGISFDEVIRMILQEGLA